MTQRQPTDSWMPSSPAAGVATPIWIDPDLLESPAPTTRSRADAMGMYLSNYGASTKTLQVSVKDEQNAPQALKRRSKITTPNSAKSKQAHQPSKLTDLDGMLQSINPPPLKSSTSAGKKSSPARPRKSKEGAPKTKRRAKRRHSFDNDIVLQKAVDAALAASTYSDTPRNEERQTLQRSKSLESNTMYTDEMISLLTSKPLPISATTSPTSATLSRDDVNAKDLKPLPSTETTKAKAKPTKTKQQVEELPKKETVVAQLQHVHLALKHGELEEEKAEKKVEAAQRALERARERLASAKEDTLALNMSRLTLEAKLEKINSREDLPTSPNAIMEAVSSFVGSSSAATAADCPLCQKLPRDEVGTTVHCGSCHQRRDNGTAECYLQIILPQAASTAAPDATPTKPGLTYPKSPRAFKNKLRSVW